MCQVQSYAAVINQIKTMQPWLPNLQQQKSFSHCIISSSAPYPKCIPTLRVTSVNFLKSKRMSRKMSRAMSRAISQIHSQDTSMVHTSDDNERSAVNEREDTATSTDISMTEFYSRQNDSPVISVANIRIEPSVKMSLTELISLVLE